MTEIRIDRTGQAEGVAVSDEGLTVTVPSASNGAVSARP